MSSAGRLYASDAVDVVGVFDEDFNQLFPDARAIRALVREGSKLMRHPVESGVTITDHRILNPNEVQLSVILRPENYTDTFQDIRAKYLEAKVLSVQTKTGSYSNMLIEDMPHDETSDMADTVAIGLKLTEVQFVTAQYAQLPEKQVKKKSNASTVKTGQKQASTPTPKQNSAAYDLIYGSK